jgi:hypothetical protein
LFLSIIINITFLIVITYIYLKKRLHIYESVLIFLSSSFIHSSKVQTQYLNKETLIVPRDIALLVIFWSLINILVPMILIWYLELLYWFRSTKLKILLTFVCVIVLLGMEEIAVRFNVLKYSVRNVNATSLYWLVLLLGSLLIQRLYRKFVLKGVN